MKRTRKPLNITVADKVKNRASKLVEQYGDGSISNLFERLVSEEFARESSDIDASTWSEPATWKAMLATMPLADALNLHDPAVTLAAVVGGDGAHRDSSASSFRHSAIIRSIAALISGHSSGSTRISFSPFLP